MCSMFISTMSYLQATMIPLLFILFSLTCASPVIPPISNNRTFNIVNNCSFPIYPALLTTNGTGPYTSGFHLDAKQNQSVWVGADWAGRLWARTNCTLNETSNTLTGSCLTGDCGPNLECKLAGRSPATLAEFDITGYKDLTYYDISLVDGYSLDMMIQPHLNSPNLATLTPKCVASTWLSSHDSRDLYENSLNETYSFMQIQRWCPREMLLIAAERGPVTVFPYPDDHDENVRTGWTPCLSACAYSNSDWDCCKGKHDKPETCGPNKYSIRAKEVCGDAYSYAYDDKKSTFTVPTGPGFDIVFCPSGISTNIMHPKGTSAASSLFSYSEKSANIGIMLGIVSIILMFLV